MLVFGSVFPRGRAVIPAHRNGVDFGQCQISYEFMAAFEIRMEIRTLMAMHREMKVCGRWTGFLCER
jgi:hypothetical protein